MIYLKNMVVKLVNLKFGNGILRSLRMAKIRMRNMEFVKRVDGCDYFRHERLNIVLIRSGRFWSCPELGEGFGKLGYWVRRAGVGRGYGGVRCRGICLG